MLKKISKISSYIIAVALVLVFSTHQAHAQANAGGLATTFINLGLGVLDNIVASLSQILLFIMHWWVVATAALFSVSINLNLHIKTFVDQTAGVYTVWKTIRDVCSLFIIFMLLYTAIKLILSREEKGLDSVGHLIKNIVIAGILINFSFFITSLLIDASNMVSLAIYKGIVSTDASANLSGDGSACLTNDPSNPATSCMVKNMLSQKGNGDVSLGDFFMSKLSPQAAYNLTLTDPNTTTINPAVTGTPAPLKTLIQGVVGAIIMFSIGMSFLFASIAFATRMVVLVLLLAFSSIWFASMIFPALKDKSEEFSKILKGQLVFMPVYLLLLYAALVVLNKSTIFTNTTDTTGTDWMTNYIVLAINDFFIIFLLNLPLVTAFSFAQSTTKWLGADKFNANAVWKKVGLTTGSAVGRNTAGRVAHIADNSAAMNKLKAWSPTIGGAVSKQIGKTANYGFGVKKAGFRDVAEQTQKDIEANYKKISTVDKTRYGLGKVDESKFDNTRKDANGLTDLDKAKAAMDQANAKEIKNAEAIAAKNAENYHKNTTNTIMGKVMSSVGVTKSQQATLGMNMAGRKAQEVIGKQRAAENTKTEGDNAQKELDKHVDDYNNKFDPYKKRDVELSRDLESLKNEIEKATQEEGHLVEAIKAEEPTNNLHNIPMGRPSTTAVQEASLAQLKTRLDAMKEQKIAKEKERGKQQKQLKINKGS